MDLLDRDVSCYFTVYIALNGIFSTKLIRSVQFYLLHVNMNPYLHIVTIENPLLPIINSNLFSEDHH